MFRIQSNRQAFHRGHLFLKLSINFWTLTLALILGITAVDAADTVHQVKKSETLSAIASQYKVSVAEIVKANRLSNPDRIYLGQKLIIPKKGASSAGTSSSSSGASDNSSSSSVYYYTVKRGDSLSRIASRNQVSVAAIMSANNLKNANMIRVGQRLKISGNAADPDLADSVVREIERPKVTPGQWKYIVVHHSGASQGSAESIDRYHREERRMENGLAYHFVIGNGRGGMKDGEIAVGGRWKNQIQGGHLASPALNRVSIGICLIGDFEKTKPSTKQIRSLISLCHYLLVDLSMNRSALQIHKQINPKPTKCPGKYFPTTLVEGAIRQRMP
jgi:LysM repeat protein